MINQIQGTTIGNIHYRVITNDDLDEAIKLTSLAFIQKEIILKAVQCSYEEYYEYMQSLKEDMIDNKTSLIAIDIDKNLIVGVLWGFDKNKPSKPIPKLGPIIMQLFHWVSESGKNYQNPFIDNQQLGIILSVQKAAVHQDYHGQGIMKNLGKYLYKQAQLLGYQYFFVLASSPQIQHLLKQWEFQEIYKFEVKEESLKNRFPKIEVNFEFTKSQFRDGIPQVGTFVKQIKQDTENS